MRTLRFIVNGQTINQDPDCNFTGLVKGSTGYLEASFAFSPDWVGCKKAASFWSLGNEYPVLLQNGRCVIPAEALKWDFFSVSVIGMKNNGKFVITTDKVHVVQRG